MTKTEDHILRLKRDLSELSTPAKATSAQRYFTHTVNCMGTTAADIKTIIKDFQKQHPELDANDTLDLVEQLLKTAHYNEETLLAFGLLNKFVKRHYSDVLLQRFEYWLEHYTHNWSQVDDLCIKTIYSFFLGRPHLIESTQHWAHSSNSWCRRASNVVWVKFIHRKIGKEVFQLDPDLVFRNCDRLLNDPDDYVQKSIGWLLKVTSQHHHEHVLHYLEANCHRMKRSTLRYAIEKMPPNLRKQLLAR